MELHKIKENKKGIYILEPGCINLVAIKGGKLLLPTGIKGLIQLRVLFQEKGKFYVCSPTSKIVIGTNFACHELLLEIGAPGFDTSPTFIYDHAYKKWWILTLGNLVMMDDKKPIGEAVAE